MARITKGRSGRLRDLLRTRQPAGEHEIRISVYLGSSGFAWGGDKRPPTGGRGVMGGRVQGLLELPEAEIAG